MKKLNPTDRQSLKTHGTRSLKTHEILYEKKMFIYFIVYTLEKNLVKWTVELLLVLSRRCLATVYYLHDAAQ